MFDQKLLSSRLRALGCAELAPLSYSLPTGHPDVSWSVHFRLLGTYRWELDGGVRWTHRLASGFAHHCLTTFAGTTWGGSALAGDGTPLASFLPWGERRALVIRGLSAEETAGTLASGIRSLVIPLVASISADEHLLHALSQNVAPMQWIYAQPLFRFAEATYLATKVGSGHGELDARLAEEGGAMQHQLDGVALEEYVRRVRVAAHAA